MKRGDDEMEEGREKREEVKRGWWDGGRGQEWKNREMRGGEGE